MLYTSLNLFKTFVEVVFSNTYLFASLAKSYHAVTALAVLKSSSITVSN